MSSSKGAHHWMAMNNRAPIVTHMKTLLSPSDPAAQGLALELGSATGAQLEVLAEAYPGLIWRPSEYAAGKSVVRGFYEQGPDGPEVGHPVAKVRHLADLDTALEQLENVLSAVEIDASTPFETWPAAVTGSGAGSYALLFASNIVHIAPWAVAEGIFAGAAASGGSLFFHGPFQSIDGKFVGVGHEEQWDMQMRGCEKGWGIRGVSEMASEGAKHGLRLVATEHPVGPAKNFVLQFIKEAFVFDKMNITNVAICPQDCVCGPTLQERNHATKTEWEITSPTFIHAIETFNTSGCIIIPNAIPTSFASNCHQLAANDLKYLRSELKQRKKQALETNDHHLSVATKVGLIVPLTLTQLLVARTNFYIFLFCSIINYCHLLYHHLLYRHWLTFQPTRPSLDLRSPSAAM